MAKATKVWYVADYEELYKAVNTARSKELDVVQYTQRHINAPWNKPAVQLSINRFKGLRQTLKLAEYLLTQYVYTELLDQSLDRHRGDHKYLRGYVVDERLASPSVARIAAMVGASTAETGKAIRHLERVGLFERVEMPLPLDAPEPEPSPEDPPADNPEEKTGGKKKKKKKKAKKKTSKRTAAKDLGRVATDLAGSCNSVERPFKEGEGEEEVPRPTASEEPEGEKETRPSASEEERAAAAAPQHPAEAEGENQSTADAVCESPGEPLKPNAESQAEHQGDLESGQAQGRSTRTPSSPAATPPIAELPSLPSGTDGGGGLDINLADAALYRYAELTRKFANPERFADLIYEAIREPHPKDSPEGAREHGVFFAYWQAVMQRKFNVNVMERLWDKNIAAAVRIGKKRDKIITAGKRKGKAGSPGAVWRYEAGPAAEEPNRERSLPHDSGQNKRSLACVSGGVKSV